VKPATSDPAGSDENKPATIRSGDGVASPDAELRNLRSEISDLGYQIDSHKTKTAGALAAGVFTFMLAAGALYDLAAGKSRVWSAIGIDPDALRWLGVGLGVVAIILLLAGLRLFLKRDQQLQAKLDRLEQTYAELTAREQR
jgi:hypothetical protein